MYRVYVYRTNDAGEPICYCVSRRFDTEAYARDFMARQNQKPRRLAKINKITY